MEQENGLQDKDYLRKRLQPVCGDADYLHLSDLLAALNIVRTEEAIGILDYGCGGSPYKSLFPNADYRRADFGEMSDLDYVIGNDSKVDEAGGSFDLILSTQVAEHVMQPAGYFAECYRLLKPGGNLICTTHGTYPDHGCPYDFQRWTADGLRRDLELAGFNVTEVKKLTTNARALMYFMQRFSGWFEPASGFPWSTVLRGYRSWQHRRPRTWHKMADRFFPSNRVVDAGVVGHDIYVGLMAISTK